MSGVLLLYYERKNTRFTKMNGIFVRIGRSRGFMSGDAANLTDGCLSVSWAGDSLSPPS